MLKVCVYVDFSEYFCISLPYLLEFTDNSGQFEAGIFSEKTHFLKNSI